jgi:hypothetical protein
MEKVIFFILTAISIIFITAAEIGLYTIIWSVQSEAAQWIFLVIMFAIPLLLAAPLCEMAETIWPNLFE